MWLNKIKYDCGKQYRYPKEERRQTQQAGFPNSKKVSNKTAHFKTLLFSTITWSRWAIKKYRHHRSTEMPFSGGGAPQQAKYLIEIFKHIGTQESLATKAKSQGLSYGDMSYLSLLTHLGTSKKLILKPFPTQPAAASHCNQQSKWLCYIWQDFKV